MYFFMFSCILTFWFRRMYWPLITLTFALSFSLSMLFAFNLLWCLGILRKLKFCLHNEKKKKKNIKKICIFFYPKNNFVLLFTPSVRLHKPEPTLVPGVLKIVVNPLYWSRQLLWKRSWPLFWSRRLACSTCGGWQNEAGHCFHSLSTFLLIFFSSNSYFFTKKEKISGIFSGFNGQCSVMEPRPTFVPWVFSSSSFFVNC